MIARRSNHKVSNSACAVITGAGSGIGRSFASELARRNATVVCSDKFEDRAVETAELVWAAGGTAFPMVCDVAAREDVERLAVAAEEKFGAPPGGTGIKRARPAPEARRDRGYRVG